jgi:predicted phage terminase large subunit-like protein
LEGARRRGTQLIQDLIEDGCHGVTRYQPTGDKTMRMHAQTAMIENGFVHIPETTPWLAEYLLELTVFPNGKHDDQADSTVQFLDWVKRPTIGPRKTGGSRSLHGGELLELAAPRRPRH